jgi:hypothetical protein
MHRLRLFVFLLPLAVALTAGSAAASSIDLDFDSRKPTKTTGMEIHIAFTKTGDPDAKPSPIRHVAIDAPRGTVLDSAAVPPCQASDEEVMVQGPAACPAESQIAESEITIETGFGPPMDPFVSPTPIFNDGAGWLEVSQDPSETGTVAVTRLAVTGNRIAGPIAAAPGGPPDFQSAVRSHEIVVTKKTRYVTTPPTCPRRKRWVTRAEFTFEDGNTHAVKGTTPCRRGGAGGSR